jgi:hypothetical protein
VQDEDFEVLYYSDEARTTSVEAANVKPVATYYTKIKGKGNFSGEYVSAVASEAANYVWNIEKAGLTIRVLPQTKVYNASAVLPSTAEGTAYEVLGKFGSDAIGTISLSGNSSANANSYIITPSVTSGQNSNYDYNFVAGTFTITPRGLTLTANNAKKVLNKADGVATDMDGNVSPDRATVGYAGVTITPTLATGETWSVPSDEVTAMKKQSGGTANTQGKLKVTRSNTAELKDVYEDVLVVSYNKDADVWKNYDIEKVPGDFTITGGKIYVTALNHEKNYGAADPDWANPTIEVDYIVTGLSGTEKLTKAPTLSCTHTDVVGEYTIDISGAEAPAGYESIVYATATFKINARPITVVANPQSLKVGDGAAKIDQTAFKIGNTDADEGLKDGDEASEVFSLTFNDAVAVNGEGKLTVGGPYAAGFKIVNGTKAGNYNITLTNAKLTVVAADAILLDDTKNLATTLVAKENTQVTFTSRQLKKGVWTTMVLPFEATVRQISNALGYAIVDLLEESGDDMNFKIAMGTIPAYTPFLVKVDEDINLNTVVVGDGSTSVDVVAPIEANLTQSNNSYNFIGKLDYEAIATDFWAVGSKMTEANFEFNKYKAGTKLQALRAYITAKPGVTAAPKIFIEEPDGTVTAIQGINADGEAVPAEGWYTLSGVKLNAAPTQKGVYIHNGKKFVVK